MQTEISPDFFILTKHENNNMWVFAPYLQILDHLTRVPSLSQMISYYQISASFFHWVISENNLNGRSGVRWGILHILVLMCWRTSWGQGLTDAERCWQSNQQWKIYYLKAYAIGLNLSFICCSGSFLSIKCHVHHHHLQCNRFSIVSESPAFQISSK